MAAAVRSAVVPGFAPLRGYPRSTVSNSANASRPLSVRTPPAAITRAACAVTAAATAAPCLRTICVSGTSPSSPTYVSTIASSHDSPSPRARTSAGAVTSNVVAKSLAYSRAIPSRAAANTIASRNVTVGSPATS